MRESRTHDESVERAPFARLACVALALFGIGFIATSQAQTYRCVEGGRVIFSDRPCGNSAKPVDIRPPAGASPRIREVTPPQSAEADARRSWDPAKHGGETYEAHQKSQAQAKLVQCIVDEYNAWNQKQKPRRVSKEERDVQWTRVREDCRKRYPEGILKPAPPPRQASADLDALRAAIASRKLEDVRALLDANVDPSSVFTAPDPVRKQLRTPALIFSINNSTDDIARLLIERGADIAAVNIYGDTALHAAAQRGRIKTMDLLLARGAGIAVQNAAGYTPLHGAIQGLDLEAVKFLLAKGAPIDAQAGRYGTPLLGAITANQNDERLSIIRHLLNAGADPNIPDGNGRYPLHAAIAGHGKRPMIEVIRALLQAGAKVDTPDKRGETPLALAERLGRAEVVVLLQISPASR